MSKESEIIQTEQDLDILDVCTNLSIKYSVMHTQICEHYCIDEESDRAEKIFNILREAAQKELDLMNEVQAKINVLIAKAAH
jgi:hypothetical protein